MGVRIEGLEDTLKFFDAQPTNARRVIQKAMKAGAKAGAKSMSKQIPGRWKKLPKSKSGIDARNEVWSRFGIYNNQVAQGHQPKAYQGAGGKTGITDWFKFYWLNYGTLTRRDRSHQFVRGVRKKVQGRRNNVGQPAQNIFDRAVETAKQSFNGAFEASLTTAREELLKR